MKSGTCARCWRTLPLYDPAACLLAGSLSREDDDRVLPLAHVELPVRQALNRKRGFVCGSCLALAREALPLELALRTALAAGKRVAVCETPPA
jgi:hypothetical protein